MAQGDPKVLLYAVATLSVIFVVLFLTMGVDVKWKRLAVGAVAFSLVLEFTPWLGVHFMIPFLIQIAVCLWMAIYWYYL